MKRTVAHIRWMRRDEVPALAGMARDIWNAYYPALISQEQIDYMLTRRYSHEALQAQMDADERFLVAEQDGALAGYFSASPLARVTDEVLRGPDAGAGSYFLHKCYVHPRFHGHGLGVALWDGWRQNVPDTQRVRLQVHRENILAHRFYQRQGFHIVAEANFPIGSGFQMTDYVMQWLHPDVSER